IAYPTCHLVAAVNASTGAIDTAIAFDAAGNAAISDGNVTCRDGAGPRPVALDRLRDPRTGTHRLVIGATNAHAVTIAQLDQATGKPTSVSQVALEDGHGDLGITRVALSPVIGMGGSTGRIVDDGAPGGDAQFVYAIGTDHTIRVADVLGVGRECDTQIDPR